MELAVLQYFQSLSLTIHNKESAFSAAAAHEVFIELSAMFQDLIPGKSLPVQVPLGMT